MTAKDNSLGFSKKQNRLINIANIARTISWLLLAFYLIRFGLKIYDFMFYLPWSIELTAGQYFFTDIFPDLLEMVMLLIKGLVFWIVLLGISNGLRMIVETNINYQEYTDDDESSIINGKTVEENPPVFYHPDFVLKLDDWTQKAAIFSIGLIIIDDVLKIPGTHHALLGLYIFESSSWVPWAISIGISIVETTLTCLVYYFGLRSLGTILCTLMEIDFNSRGIQL